MMNEDYIECSDLSGKTIQRVHVYRNTGDGAEVQIEFTDGTSFSCAVSHPQTVKACLYKGGIGTPQIIHDYEF
jgi:hypothetical protein